jgi:hypothetical protein
MSLLTPLIVGGAVVALVLVALVILVVRDPGAVQRRIESIFRRPERPPKTAGDEQYYRPYWSR